MKKILIPAIFVLISLASCMSEKKEKTEKITKEQSIPKYLYKVVSVQDWNLSKGKKLVKLSPMDKEFVHLARQDQLAKITDKFWGKIKKFIILKLDSSKLSGDMKFEANPGGANKYYHLYNGSIPLYAIVETKEVDRSLQK